jgi:anti-sigma factor RsiW
VSCPTDNDYALLLDGQLGPEERAGLEQHIDGCAECRALVTALGRAYAPSQSEAVSRGPLDVGGVGADVAVAPPAQDQRAASEHARFPSESSRQLLVLELVTLGVHLVWSGLFLPHAWHAVFGPAHVDSWAERSFQSSWDGPGVVALVFAIYCAVWAPLGALWAGASAYGFWRGRAWARRAAKAHVCASLPSGFLVPLGLLTWLELGRASGKPDRRAHSRCASSP